MNMKIIIKIIIKMLLLTFAIVTFGYTFSNASSSATYFYSDAIKVQNENIEIVSDEILIDTTSSVIENNIVLQNPSDKEIDTELVLPLENTDFDITIKNLSIKLNDTDVDYTKNENGDYVVKSRISPSSGKKVHIQYQTDNDLQNASMIKYNFDNFSDKKIGKLKIDVKIDDKNIPLVEKIYPYHYTFDNNTISVEYYNYEVNTITKDFIVKKATFNSLLYGRDAELTDTERNIITEWYSNGKIAIPTFDLYDLKWNNLNIIENIIDYQKIKNGITFMDSGPSEPLLYFMDYSINSYRDDFYENTLKGKTVCIDYVETEGDKDLYLEKTADVQSDNEGFEYIYDLIKVPESTILRIKGPSTSTVGNLGAKVIFVGCGIDNEDLKATEEEKISYVNQINSDMYIRIEIYDGTIHYKPDEYGIDQRLGSGMVGYYGDKSLEIAKAFALTSDDKLITNKNDYNNYYSSHFAPFYSSYEEYAKNYYNDYYNDCMIKLSNEYIIQNCEVPTVVQFIGNRINKDNKYVVDFFDSGFYDGIYRGLITTDATLKTSQAQSMLKANKQKNANIKSEIENKISSIAFVDDEAKIQEDLQKEELEKQASQDSADDISYMTNKITFCDIVVYSIIGIGIFICIILLIINHSKKTHKKSKKTE